MSDLTEALDEGFDQEGFGYDHSFYIEAGQAVLAVLKGSPDV